MAELYLTKPQAIAMRMLLEAGSCTIDRYGRVICLGTHGGLEASTWLRLVAMGAVVAHKGRLVPAPAMLNGRD